MFDIDVNVHLTFFPITKYDWMNPFNCNVSYNVKLLWIDVFLVCY